MNRRLPAVAISAVLGLGSVSHAASSTDRVDVPIKQIVLPNQNIRYSVPVTVGRGGTPFEAALDTGSFGLRVLGAAVQPDQYQATDIRRRRPFSAGIRFNGFIAKAVVAVGPAVSGREMQIQVVDKVDCVESKPHCPVSKMKEAEYLMAGDGHPGQGFKAILGISMRQPASADAAENPLLAIGDASWIVILPRPGSTEAGHLILNPTADDKQGFTMIHLEPQTGGDGSPGWADGALAGCLVDVATSQRFCGKTLLDTGGPGLSVDSATSDGPTRWKPGTPAKLELEGGEKPIEMNFKASAQPADRVTVRPARNPNVLRISAGTLPYFHYAVLYDAKAGMMGFKQRAASEP